MEKKKKFKSIQSLVFYSFGAIAAAPANVEPPANVDPPENVEPPADANPPFDTDPSFDFNRHSHSL